VKLWRLSNRAHAHDLAGGYGLVSDGRWNITGRPCIYASTGAGLPVLEKRVHVLDPTLLPPQAMVEYDVPDSTSSRTIVLADLQADWIRRHDITQQIGHDWLQGATTALLFIPSAIVPIPDTPDVNVLINPLHPDIKAMTIARRVPFTLDIRLFS